MLLSSNPRMSPSFTYMIPPALRKIGQLMLQSVLKELKHDRYHPTQPPVTQQQCLHPPAKEMERHKEVQLVLKVSGKNCEHVSD